MMERRSSVWPCFAAIMETASALWVETSQGARESSTKGAGDRYPKSQTAKYEVGLSVPRWRKEDSDPSLMLSSPALARSSSVIESQSGPDDLDAARLEVVMLRSSSICSSSTLRACSRLTRYSACLRATMRA